MFYYIGPWELSDGKYVPPQGTVGLYDLRSVKDQSDTKRNGVGFFVTEKSLDSNYYLLCSSDFRSARAATGHLDTLQSLFGYRPEGDMVSDLIFDLITNGAHPDGLGGFYPLLPNFGKIELSINGHGVVKKKKLKLDSKEFSLIRDTVRENYKKIRKDHPGKDQHRKYLAMLGVEYQLKNPEDYFIPNGLPKERPIRPSTVLSETWPTNGTTLTSGQDQTWNANAGEVVSNEWNITGTDEDNLLYVSTSLSSSNIWTSLDVIKLEAPPTGIGALEGAISPIVRYDNSGPSYYYIKLSLNRDADLEYIVYKVVNSVETVIQARTAFPGTKLGLKRIEAVGGQLYYYDQGSVQIGQWSDSSIPGGVLGGFRASNDTNSVGNEVIVDDIQIADEQFLSLNPLGVNRYLPLKGNNNRFSVWRVI